MYKSLKRQDVKLLIIHCSATQVTRPFSVESLIATGIGRFGQPSYHYYIRMDGEVVPILPENIRGAHARNYNRCCTNFLCGEKAKALRLQPFTNILH